MSNQALLEFAEFGKPARDLNHTGATVKALWALRLRIAIAVAVYVAALFVLIDLGTIAIRHSATLSAMPEMLLPR